MILDQIASRIASRYTALMHTLYPPSSSTYPPDFYFCRIYPGDTFPLSVARHLHSICARLELQRGARVLMLGSGTGSAAVDVARFADVDVVGVESDVRKVKRAKARVESAQLSHRISFVFAPLEQLSRIFSDESFDAVIAIESLKDIEDPLPVYHSICRLLKSGGKFAHTTWCWTPSFTPTADATHRRLAALFADTLSKARLPGSRTLEGTCNALRDARMDVVWREDLGARQDKAMWYVPVERALGDSGVMWSLADKQEDDNRNANREEAGEEEEELCPLFGGLTREEAILLVQAAKCNLFTPLAFFVAERP